MAELYTYFAVSLITAVVLLSFGIYGYVKKKSLRSLIVSLVLAAAFGAQSIIVGVCHNMIFAFVVGIIAGLLCAMVGLYLLLSLRQQGKVRVLVLSLGWINFAYYGGLLHSYYYHHKG